MNKRLFDLAAAALGLLLCLPLFALVAVAIKLDSPGPVFFRQTRIGRHGQPFRIHKFRSMHVRQPADARPITVGQDPRITRVGAVLRRWKLDELPQLIDVLDGSMSLIGPRPEVPRYVALYPDALRRAVLSVRPGITDPASIRFRNENDLLAGAADPDAVYRERILPEKLRLQAEYVRSRSFAGDMRILYRTFVKIATE